MFKFSHSYIVFFSPTEVPERDGGDRVPVRAAAEGDQPGEPAQVDDRAEAGGRAEELVLQKSGKEGFIKSLRETLLVELGFITSKCTHA